MPESQQRTRKPRLFSILITIGFIFLGGIVGVFIGALLYTYLIPFWRHTEIDVEDHNINDIVLVDYYYLDNTDLSQDKVIVKTDEGDYFSYHENQWHLTELPPIDKTRFPYNYPPCNEWSSPPPAVYLQSVKDSVGVEFAHALAITSRCYVLLADGSLHSWTRSIDVFAVMFIGVVSLVVGMIVGGIAGKYVANRKYQHRFQ